MHSFRRIQAEGWWGQRTTTSSNLKPICLPNGWNCKHSRINFNHMLIFKSNYLKCITFWSCGGFFFRLKTGTCDAVWPTSFLLWPGFNSSHRRLGPKWMPWLTSEVLSVEHGKKQPTNTRLATADELWTHRRHAHNTPASSSESGRGTTKTSWVLNSVIKKDATLALHRHYCRESDEKVDTTFSYMTVNRTERGELFPIALVSTLNAQRRDRRGFSLLTFCKKANKTC